MALFDTLQRSVPTDTIRIMENTENDDFSYVTGEYCFVDHIIKELLTPKRTYVFDPEYGSNIYKYIYDQLTDSSITSIISEVESIVKQYSDIVTYNISHTYSETNKTVYIQVSISVQNREYFLNLEVGKNKLIPTLEYQTKTIG